MRQVARRRAGRGDPVHRDASLHRLVQPPQPSERIAQVRGETDHTEHSVTDRGDRGNDRHADEGTRDCGRRYVGQGVAWLRTEEERRLPAGRSPEAVNWWVNQPPHPLFRERRTPRAAFEYPPPRAVKRARLSPGSSGYPAASGEAGERDSAVDV